MKLSSTLKEITDTLVILSEWKPKLLDDAKVLNEVVAFNNGVVIRKSLPVVGSIEARCTVSADTSGNVKLVINKATLWGMTFFGLVKIAIANFLLAYAERILPIKLWKSSKGDMVISIPGVQFTSANVSKDTLNVGFYV